MQSFYQRHKRKLLALAAAGAAGGAAYYVYTQWLQCKEEADDATVSGYLLRPFRASTSAPASKLKTLEEEEDKKLAAHFESVEGIAVFTTLPALVPELKTQLAAKTEVERLVACLKAKKHPDSGAPLTAEDKVELWNRLKLESFTHTIGAAWSLPLLNLLVRVQLYILGRFLYTDRVLQQPAANGKVAPSTTGRTNGRLSTQCQHRYLEHASYLSSSGLNVLLAQIRSCLDMELSKVSLTQACTIGDLLLIMSQTQRRFTGTVAPGLWADLLLPESTVPNKSPLSDDQLVLDMLREARVVLSSEQFSKAVKAAVALSSQAMAWKLTKLFGQQSASSMPLAKLVPIVSHAGDQLLDDALGLAEGESDLPAVKSLCRWVYSSGPPL